MERRNFNQLFALGSLGLAFSSPITNKKISLAQWSLHRAIKINKELSPNDFSIKAHEMGFNAVEYVSTLYWNELKSRSIRNITKELLSKSKDNNIKNLLIMVDGEGDLATKNNLKREKAIENHIKWIEMAKGKLENANLPISTLSLIIERVHGVKFPELYNLGNIKENEMNLILEDVLKKEKPVAYIVGFEFFYGYKIRVDENISNAFDTIKITSLPEEMKLMNIPEKQINVYLQRAKDRLKLLCEKAA